MYGRKVAARSVIGWQRRESRAGRDQSERVSIHTPGDRVRADQRRTEFCLFEEEEIPPRVTHARELRGSTAVRGIP